MGLAIPISQAVETAPDGARFHDEAARCLTTAALDRLFADALAMEGVTGHLCCARGDDGGAVPLFGDSPAIAGSACAAGVAVSDDAGAPLTMWLTPATALTDRAARSRLRLLSAIAAGHGAALCEAVDDEAKDAILPTSIERLCLGLTLAGWDRIDIADRLDRSPGAVGVHLHRAAARLGALSIAEAVATASRRGLISDDARDG